MKKLLALATSVLLGLGLAVVGSSTAYAGGSDSPTPYTVTVDGIQLPDGVSFRDNGHVNIKTNLGNAGIHFESQNWPADHPKTFYIGENFLPWDAFGFDKAKLCVSWVQIDFYNEHVGEGGQSPVGMGCEQPPVDQCEAIPAEHETQYKYQREVTNYVTQYHFRKFTRERTQEIVSDAIWQNFSPNRDQGPLQSPPTWPSDPRGTWQHQGKDIPGGHQGPDGVYQKGQGNSSWFYRQAAVISWGEWGAWTPWEPETHTSWELSDAPLGQPAAHSSGSSHGLQWERQWQAQFDGQTRQAESGTRVETSDWVKSAPAGDGWTQIDTRQVETKPGVPAKWQDADPSAECFNGPEKPEPLTGTESKDTSPVCVVPNNGKATVDLLSRDWVQNPAWSNDTHEWSFGEKEYTKWAVVKTTTVDSESCAPEEPQKPKPPVQTPPRDELATTGADSIFWLYSGGALLVGAGILALMLGLAARKRRVE